MTLHGEVTDTGGQTPTVWFLYWQTGGDTTNLAAAGLQPAAFETSVSGLIPGADYQYVAVASNSAGAVQSGASGFSLHAAASVLHVATNGSNTAGTNWSTAYRDIQSAFDIAEQGDTIYAAGHTFSGDGTPLNAYAFRWQNATGIVLRGGYQAATDDPLPGLRDTALWPTILRSSGANPARVLNMINVSNAVIEQVILRDGYPNPGTAVSVIGGGIYLSGCRALEFKECQIVANRAYGYPSGGGMYLANSHAWLTDSILLSNTAEAVGNADAYGGGALVDGTSRLTILRSLVSRNTSKGSGMNIGYAGGIHVVAGGILDIRESVVSANLVQTGNSEGGAILNLGTLWMQNCLVVSNRNTRSPDHSGGIYFKGGTATLVNCTVAGNYGVGLHYNAGTIAITNSIIWGHTTADLVGLQTDGDGYLLNVGYSLFGGFPGMVGINGCISDDPLFVDTTYYHLQSKRGHYVGGYFSGGSWLSSLNNSPCIDTGYPDPAKPWMGVEPEPNGKRSNMGAYGNTTVASKGAAPSGTVFMLR